jgi:DNA-binding LacI/PurR family transcriptional regulator
MSAKQPTGIRLIAQELGVSIATVSRALNPETAHLVKEERRKRIQAEADRLHYLPNPGAKMLQTGVNHTLVVIMPGAEDIFFSEFHGRLMGGLIQSIAKAGWEIRISAQMENYGGDMLEELRRVGMGASGVIYAGLPLTQEQAESLSDYKRPLVVVRSVLPSHYPVEQAHFDVVGVNNHEGALLAVKHITQMGHRRVGVILGPSNGRDFYERECGYLEGFKRFGLDDAWIFRGSFDQDTGRAGCEHFLGLEDRPTALICVNDNVAFGALDYARRIGVRCPEDISIIGFDDGPWASACWPKLTTIRQPLAYLADRAVDMVLTAVSKSGAGVPRRVDLPAELNLRESTTYCTLS